MEVVAEAAEADVADGASLGMSSVTVIVAGDYEGIAQVAVDWAEVRRMARVTFHTEPFACLIDAVAATRDADVLCVMRERLPVTRELIARLPRLKCVVTTGPRNKRIDLVAAAERGIVVCGTPPGMAITATAEHTWALLLASARRIVPHEREIRDGGWQPYPGTLLSGRTLGLLGLGSVGAQVARYGSTFGMDVIAWSPTLTQERASAHWATCVSFDELVRRSDVLSVHIPHNAETDSLVDATVFDRMKDDATFVNTSRGAVVDESALAHWLAAKPCARAALDVFEDEPLTPDSPLRTLPNVTLSPHVGGFTSDVLAVWYQGVVEDVVAFLRDDPIRLISAPDSSST